MIKITATSVDEALKKIKEANVIESRKWDSFEIGFRLQESYRPRPLIQIEIDQEKKIFHVK